MTNPQVWGPPGQLGRRRGRKEVREEPSLCSEGNCEPWKELEGGESGFASESSVGLLGVEYGRGPCCRDAASWSVSRGQVGWAVREGEGVDA